MPVMLMMVMMMDSITAASRWWVITSVLRVGAAAGDWCSSSPLPATLAKYTPQQTARL